MEAVNAQVAAGVPVSTALGYIISTPKYKGEYQKAYDTVYESYYKNLEKKIAEVEKLHLEGKIIPRPTIAQEAALKHMSDILGVGWFTMCSDNLNTLIRIGKSGGLVAA